MSEKVLLILIDGMRPDAILACQHPFLRDFMRAECTYTLQGRTVMPSLTLPCHMSLFLSVPPQRHGILENTYIRPSHKIDSLFDVLYDQGKKNLFYHTWHELRDLCKPGALARDELCNWYSYGSYADVQLCQRAVEAISSEAPDFVFYYSGNTDEVAHKQGWMSQPYLEAVSLASANIQTFIEALPEGYSVVIMADHGGHDRSHGTDMYEDMTIPILFYGRPWAKGKELESVDIMDVAPTILTMMDCRIPEEWDGRSLL